MSKYTKADFENAKFAEHPTGKLAVRTADDPHFAWKIVGGVAPGGVSDHCMALADWVPVPAKPTVTESQLERAAYAAWGDCVRDTDRAFLEHLGITVVPDPEPMPTIEFARDIMRFESGDPDTRDVPRWAVNMAAYLTDAGYVKAPEADDDH